MTELRTLIDEWLDRLPSAAPLDRPGALVGLHARGVAEAVQTGRRRRRQRRAIALGGIAAAVMAVTVLAGVLRGTGSVTTVPRPPAGTTSPPTSATAGPAATSSTGAVSPTPGATPVTVTYPDGGGGTRSITWPLPASGIPWAASAVPYPITAVSTQGALALERSLRAALPDLPLQAHEVDDVATLGVVDGHATGFFAQVRTVAVTSPHGAEAPTQYWAETTRGGLTLVPVVFDFCGTWPSDALWGLGTKVDSPYFELSGPRTCSIRDTADGHVLVHLVAQQGARHGPGDPPPAPLQLISFTVREDGTAVAVSAIASLDSRWSDARIGSTFDQLDKLATTLPYPPQP